MQYDSVTLNSQTLALGGTLTLDTDDISEGGNLYFTDSRAIEAIEDATSLSLTGNYAMNCSGDLTFQIQIQTIGYGLNRQAILW